MARSGPSAAPLLKRDLTPQLDHSRAGVWAPATALVTLGCCTVAGLSAMTFGGQATAASQSVLKGAAGAMLPGGPAPVGVDPAQLATLVQKPVSNRAPRLAVALLPRSGSARSGAPVLLAAGPYLSSREDGTDLAPLSTAPNDPTVLVAGPLVGSADPSVFSEAKPVVNGPFLVVPSSSRVTVTAAPQPTRAPTRPGGRPTGPAAPTSEPTAHPGGTPTRIPAPTQTPTTPPTTPPSPPTSPAATPTKAPTTAPTSSPTATPTTSSPTPTTSPTATPTPTDQSTSATSTPTAPTPAPSPTTATAGPRPVDPTSGASDSPTPSPSQGGLSSTLDSTSSTALDTPGPTTSASGLGASAPASTTSTSGAGAPASSVESVTVAPSATGEAIDLRDAAGLLLGTVPGATSSATGAH